MTPGTPTAAPPHGWAAIVQARTFALDYSRNFLALPSWFEKPDLDWARKYVAAARSSLQLAAISRTARLCLFKNSQYCVVGLTALSGDVSEDMTRDQEGREFYVFLGYASKIDPETYPNPPHHLPIPDLSSLRHANFALFRPLYDCVRRQFHQKALIGKHELEPTATHSEPWIPSVADQPRAPSHPIDLNFEEQTKVKIWPRAIEADLWAAASRSLAPLSLCLGIGTAKDALASAFGNITLEGFNHEKTLYRQLQPAPVLQKPVQPAELFHIKIDLLGRSVVDLAFAAPSRRRRSRAQK